MLSLACKILIGDLFFDYVHEVQIKKTWKNMTSSATIKFPRNLKTKNIRIDDAIKVGQKVSISLGYNAELIERFTGYVTEIGAATAIVEIKCEDEMWKLKQSSLTKSWPKAKVEDIISYIKKQTNATWKYEVLGDNITVGVFTAEKMSAAKMLLKLKDDYGICSFFWGGTLMVGKPYGTDSSTWHRVQLDYGRNVITWKDLTYKRNDDVKIKVTAVNHLPNGTKKEIKIGDEGGEERTLDFYNLDASTLKTSANALYTKMKYDGYRGKLTLFGSPVVSDRYVVNINDWRSPDRKGSFFVDEVDITFKIAQYRQVITLGPVASIENI